MLTVRAPKERQILTFKKPLDSSPYTADDFNVLVKEFCKKSKSHPRLKIAKTIFIGDIGVGKTSIINRFREKTFVPKMRSTIGVDCYLEGFDILGVPFNIQIWDTAGQERFRCIASPYFRGTTVVVLVFDIRSVESLFHCQKWLETALEANNSKPSPYIMLLGNKLDDVTETAYAGVKEIAESLAKKLGAEYWDVSSKTGENVDNFFLRLAILAFEWMVLRELSGLEDLQVLSLSNAISTSRGSSKPNFRKKKHCSC